MAAGQSMKLHYKVALSALVCILLLAGSVLVRACGPGGNGVLARIEGSDGSTYLVTQEWNDWAEPYTVSFFVRKSGGRWGWCYVRHQSERWRSANLKFDDATNCVRLYEGDQLCAEYLKASREFSLFDGDGQRIRTLAAPQEWEDPKFQ